MPRMNVESPLPHQLLPHRRDRNMCGCDRTFTSARGRAVHQQRAHKEWYDAKLQIPTDKARWTPEEVALLARKEVELASRSTPPRFMNQELLKTFPQRTIEAIKGRRKREDYRNMVATLLTQQEGVNE